MRLARHLFPALLTAALIAAPAFAAPLGTMVLEGQLRTVAGSAVPDGDYTLKVSLYKDKQGLKALHSELIATKVRGGGFTISLGLSQALKAEIFADGSAAWVGIQVGTEKELPRLPLNHVAYAFAANTAWSAASLSCTGCIKAEHLAQSVLADYAKSADLKAYVGVGQACKAGQLSQGFDQDGKIVCATDANDTYDGKSFATSGQACPEGKVVAKIDADGKIACARGGQTYDGKNFALSGQKCPAGQLVAAIGATGKLACKIDEKGHVSGKDFALSDQSCGPGKVIRGIDAAGKVGCAPIAYEKAIPAGALTTKEVANLASGKLADGKTPWAVQRYYDITGKWLRPVHKDNATLIHGNGKQTVFRTDGDTQYAAGIGNYPWAFMYGGDKPDNRTMVIQKDGTLWTKSYGWLHTRFAAANKACKSGEVVRGIDKYGAILCVKDKDTPTEYAAGTFMKLESGHKFSADLGSFDGRYVNEGQGNSITSAMIKNGQVTAADIGANQVNGGHVADGSLTGADLKKGSVGSADIGANQVNGGHVADGSLTGADLKDGSVGSADVANESLTGADLKNGTVSGADIANESITSADVKNESLTTSDIKNGTLSYVDTNVNSIQRRVTGTCPAGQAIVAVGKDGKVTCAGIDKLTVYKGTCTAGQWRRIAQNKGSRWSGLFNLYDSISSGGHSTVTFRASGAYGDRANFSFTLLGHGRYATPTFGQARISSKTKGSSGDWHFLDVLCKRNGAVWMTIADNQQSAGLTPVAFSASSGVPSGYATTVYKLDYLFSVGGTGDRLSVFRDGRLRIRTASGYTDIGAFNTGWSHFETDRGRFHFNKAVTVAGGAYGSDSGKHLYLQPGGTTQAWLEYNTGWQRNNQGLELCKKNATGCGLKVSDDGGFYDWNNGWITAQISDGLQIRNAANKGWSSLQSGSLTVNGNSSTSGNSTTGGTVNANAGLKVDGNTVVDDGAGWHRTYGATGWYSQTYGGGIYMTDSTWVRVYNGKGFLVANSVDIETGNSQIYLSPDGNGRVEIRSKKNGTPYIDFSNDKSIDYDARLMLTANDMLTVYGSRMTVNSGYGTITIGPGNTSHAHIETDRSNFYFNKELRVDTGIIGSYNEDLQLRRAGSTGLTIRSGDVLLSRTLHANNHDINYVNQLHFHDGLRFVDEGNNNYLRYRWDSGGAGGIKFYDGNDVRQGYVYANGSSGNSREFGLLDADGSWAVRVQNNVAVDLRVNGATKLYVHGSGVNVTGTLKIGSKTLSTYIRDYINGSCYIYFGWRDSVNGNNWAPSKYMRVRSGYCQNLAGGANTCGTWYLGGTSVRMAGLNTDGNVNGDDKFYIGMHCF